MNSINDLILELTTTCKTPKGVSVYEDNSCILFKSIPKFFSEINAIRNEIGKDSMEQLAFLLCFLGDHYING